MSGNNVRRDNKTNKLIVFFMKIAKIIIENITLKKKLYERRKCTLITTKIRKIRLKNHNKYH